MSQTISSDCEYCRLNKPMYNLKQCSGCAERIAKTARKDRKQLDAMLSYIERYQDRVEIEEAVRKKRKPPKGGLF